MKMILLRSLLAVVLLSVTIIFAISCARQTGLGGGGGGKFLKVPVVYDQADPTDKRFTRARILSFPLAINSSGDVPTDLLNVLGSDRSLFKIKAHRQGVDGKTEGTLPSTAATDPLSPDFVLLADQLAKQSPPLTGVSIQAGRGRGGAAVGNPAELKKDKDIVDRVKIFFDSH